MGVKTPSLLDVDGVLNALSRYDSLKHALGTLRAAEITWPEDTERHLAPFLKNASGRCGALPDHQR